MATRGLRAFLNLEAGVVRNATEMRPEIRRAEPGKPGEVMRLRALLAERDRQVVSLQAGSDGSEGVRPENLIWIFGTGRSGNTWLSSIMGDIRGHATWGEPRVGILFGEFYFVNSFEGQRKSNNFILS